MKGSGRLGARIGIGRTADVYAWGDGTIIKLLRPGFPDAMGDEEARAAARATDAGLAAPRFLGTERVEGRFGLVYERVDGPSMLDELMRRPWRAHAMACKLAELHAATHAGAGSSLPSRTAQLMRAITRVGDRFGRAAREAAERRMAELPDGDAIVHGDLHPGNVVMTPAGPRIIDWLTAGSGPPAADVARTAFLIGDTALPPEMPRAQRALIGLLRRRFLGAYLRRYAELRSLDAGELAAWRLPILLARATEDVEGEEEHLGRLIARELGATPD